MLTNFQYLATCVSFSVAYPFRKNFWTNWPFTISIVCIVLIDLAFLFLPAKNPLCTYFDVLPFTGQEGYTYRLAIGILINTLLTFAAEKLVISRITSIADRRGHEKKKEHFKTTMETLFFKSPTRNENNESTIVNMNYATLT